MKSKSTAGTTTNEAGGDFGAQLRSWGLLFPTEQTSDRLIAQSVNLSIKAAVAQTLNNHLWDTSQREGKKMLASVMG